MKPWKMDKELEKDKISSIIKTLIESTFILAHLYYPFCLDRISLLFERNKYFGVPMKTFDDLSWNNLDNSHSGTNIYPSKMKINIYFRESEKNKFERNKK